MIGTLPPDVMREGLKGQGGGRRGGGSCPPPPTPSPASPQVLPLHTVASCLHRHIRTVSRAAA
eukprot:1584035-Alexandrium_andersonii.AAC.1